MAEVLTKKLYNGKIEINFYPNSHRYKLKGERTYLISVTACTGIIDKSRALIPWAVGLDIGHVRQYLESRAGEKFTAEELNPVLDEALTIHNKKKEEAADIGSQVHDWAEKYALSKIEGSPLPDINDDMPEPVLNGINGFLDWVGENNVEFLEAERMIYSKEHGFVGLTDLVAKVNDKKVIIDYKTAKGIYNEMGYQIAAYKEAWEEEMEENLDGAMILHFNKENGDFTVKEYEPFDVKENFKTFLACYTIKQREKELAKVYYNNK